MANIISFYQLPTKIQSCVKSKYLLYEDLNNFNYYVIDDKYYQEYHDEYSVWVWVDSHFEEIDWNDWINNIKNKS